MFHLGHLASEWSDDSEDLLTDIQTLDIVLCLPTHVAYKATFPKPDEKLKKPTWTLQQTAAPVSPTEWYRQRGVVVAMAAVIGSSIVLLDAFGLRFPLVFLPLTWIVPVVSTWYFDQMSVRRVSQVMIAYIVSSALRDSE